MCVCISLFRSQNADLHNEGYILELDCCSSLDHLTDQKILPEFIKKVSAAVDGPWGLGELRVGIALRACSNLGLREASQGPPLPAQAAPDPGARWLPAPQDARPRLFRAGMALIAGRPAGRAGPTARKPFKSSRWCEPPASSSHFPCGSSLPRATFHP